MTWLRDVDRWFCSQVSPHETVFLSRARRIMGDGETARDLVHDAYAKLLTGDTWRSISHPRAYVLRVIYNLGLNRLRDARVVPMQQLAAMETLLHADSAPDAFQTVAGRQAFHKLLSALEALPPQCRRVVVLRRIHEMPPRDIAQELGISLSTVEKHLAKGLSLLADMLDEGEDEIPSAVQVSTKSRQE